eukprot:UN01934
MFDLRKDPYFSQNDMGQIECSLCKTTHRTPESYVQHTEGKKHKESLNVRQFHFEKLKQSKNPLAANIVGGAAGSKAMSTTSALNQPKIQRQAIQKPRIGRPQYEIVKQYDPITGHHALAFKIHYPFIDKNIRPRYNIISSYQQNVEPPNTDFQYVVFAADPYDNIAIKIPNVPRNAAKRLISDWDTTTHTFILQMGFSDDFNSQWRKQQEVLGPGGLLYKQYDTKTVEETNFQRNALAKLSKKVEYEPDTKKKNIFETTIEPATPIATSSAMDELDDID